ncbi:hypothetical protein BV898_00597 [Hypsibius exemplaris]|uniref:Uncharacterized protein n=1 Tax=Hypsibius exemplaris TaxID=2072580 RepID=A0A1W0XDZ2_HYPEX|nr:hypothetical protein BV898_00597 [Hypsibius exemplaris]
MIIVLGVYKKIGVKGLYTAPHCAPGGGMNSQRQASYISGSSQLHLPEQNSGYYERKVSSAGTSPSGRRCLPNSGRRFSKPDNRYLLSEPLQTQSSRSQEDVRTSASSYSILRHLRRPSPHRDRLQPSPLPTQFTEDDDDDDDDHNTSTDDELDGGGWTGMRQRAPPRPAQQQRCGSKSSSHYSGSSPTDDRQIPPPSPRSRMNINKPEMADGYRRPVHRRASLHLDVMRNPSEYISPNSSSVPINNQQQQRNHNIYNNHMIDSHHSPSPHQSTNPTMQLHFGGQNVKDYNQYSSQITSLSLSPRQSADHQKEQPFNGDRSSSSRYNNRARSPNHPLPPPVSPSHGLRSNAGGGNGSGGRPNYGYGPSSQQHSGYY